jgi:heme/copper-type cytochrome/quinol oxidase subunit 4
VGVALGVALGLGHLAYFHGAAESLSDTALRLVNTAGLTLAHDAAKHGAPRRAVEGLTAVLAVLLPGLTAFLLVLAGRSTLRLRAIVAVLLAVLGVAAFFYLPGGNATGVAVLALAAAGLVVAATGPLVVAPLVALATLIALAFLPRLLASHSTLPNAPVNALHQALFATAGSPLWLRVVVLLLAAAPFALAARLVVR